MSRFRRIITNAAQRAVAGELAPLMQALMGLSDSYHPERHYMRGPGPKWHAKHDAVRVCSPH
jgi:hypothetical protein